MNVFSVHADGDHYRSLELVNEEADWEAMYKFNGTPIGAGWQPLCVDTLCDEELSEQLPPGDYPRLFAGVPVFSSRAVEKLGPILRGNGELLPLECEEERYFIFNTTRVVDALDEAGSEIIRFPDGKKVLDIKRFAFVASKLTNVDIFKLPQQPLGGVFVTDRFVQTVREVGLLGFIFDWLWASEQRSGSPVYQAGKVQ